MIKLFRNIRKNLLSEGKSITYFKYAIGEIVLVVIGILIALQINNWNEKQKSNLKETQILNEILNSINSDLELYENVFDKRLELKKQGIDSLLIFINQNKNINDNQFMRLLNKSSINIYVSYDSGPYDALKSTGFDIIRKDSLRANIINAYESGLPVYQNFIIDYDFKKEPIIAEYLKNITESYVCDGENRPLHFHRKPKFENILKNQEFLELLNIESKKYGHYQSRLQSLRNVLNRVKSQILKELKKND